MPVRAFVFDAYGTLFDVHAAIARHRDAAGPEADRFSEIWRIKAARICLDAVGRRTLCGLLDADRTRARSCVCALPVGRSRAAPRFARLLLQARCLSRRARGARRAQGEGREDRDPVERLAEDARCGGGECADRRTISTRCSRSRRSASTSRAPKSTRWSPMPLRMAPDDVAFVSSNRWDVMGATAFGFRCVWVNRANMPDEYPEFAPVTVVRDLASLAALDL